MKPLLILLCLLTMSASALAAEKIAFKTRDGIWYHWDDFYEQDGNYCTYNTGEICMPKSEVIEVLQGEFINVDCDIG